MINMDILTVADTADKMFQLKYKDQFQPLKKNFISFYNLSDQICTLYISILDSAKQIQQIDDSENLQQWQTLKQVINSSLIILNRISQNPTINLDLNYCQKFSKNFQTNLNIICSFYHSLSHIEVISGKMKFEKKKIVEGINKLFRLHSEIKGQYRNNINQLRNISKFRHFLLINMKEFSNKKEFLKSKAKISHNLVQTIIQFYQTTLKIDEKMQQSTQIQIRLLMKSYFKIMHQFYETQTYLNDLLKPITNFCEQLKSKKRGTTNYGTVDAVNNFTRITSQLLKPNFSIKNLKKFKIQDYQKTLNILLGELAQQKFINPNGIGFNIFQNINSNKHNFSDNLIDNNSNRLKIQEKIEQFIEQIMDISTFLIDCTKQFEKVQNSGLLNIVQEYKDKLTSNQSIPSTNTNNNFHKKFTIKLCQYQKYMHQFYALHQQIKHFQRVVQQFMLMEFGMKINVEIPIINQIRFEAV